MVLLLEKETLDDGLNLSQGRVQTKPIDSIVLRLVACSVTLLSQLVLVAKLRLASVKISLRHHPLQCEVWSETRMKKEICVVNICVLEGTWLNHMLMSEWQKEKKRIICDKRMQIKVTSSRRTTVSSLSGTLKMFCFFFLLVSSHVQMTWVKHCWMSSEITKVNVPHIN